MFGFLVHHPKGSGFVEWELAEYRSSRSARIADRERQGKHNAIDRDWIRESRRNFLNKNSFPEGVERRTFSFVIGEGWRVK